MSGAGQKRLIASGRSRAVPLPDAAHPAPRARPPMTHRVERPAQLRRDLDPLHELGERIRGATSSSAGSNPSSDS
jgi:hypothetical protein